MRAIILFAHGARNPEWAMPIMAIRDAMYELQPEIRVECAFLEFMAPTLLEAVGQLTEAGFNHVTVVPIFMAQTGHAQRDLPEMLETARRQYPQLTLRISEPIGNVPAIVRAIAAYALEV
jgi:sirohydrochlorin cobaltochelatase